MILGLEINNKIIEKDGEAKLQFEIKKKVLIDKNKVQQNE